MKARPNKQPRAVPNASSIFKADTPPRKSEQALPMPAPTIGIKAPILNLLGRSFSTS